MKRWIRVSIILVIAICSVGAGMVATTRALAFPGGPTTWQVTCQVFFSDGPNQGKTEPVSFQLSSDGGFIASSSDYAGGVSRSGTWSFADAALDTVNFTFSAQLATIPGATLTVTATIPNTTTTAVGTSEGAIVDNSGAVLVVTHTTTTCPDFLPPCGLDNCS